MLVQEMLGVLVMLVLCFNVDADKGNDYKFVQVIDKI